MSMISTSLDGNANHSILDVRDRVGIAVVRKVSGEVHTEVSNFVGRSSPGFSDTLLIATNRQVAREVFRRVGK